MEHFVKLPVALLCSKHIAYLWQSGNGFPSFQQLLKFDIFPAVKWCNTGAQKNVNICGFILHRKYRLRDQAEIF